jgi:chromosome segregation ATPase
MHNCNFFVLKQAYVQVNNPVSLLNQDTSRNFLHSSKPADKYKLFMKATQLEQLQGDYQMILEQRDIMTTSLELKRASLPDLQREVVKWEEKFKNLAQLDELAASKQQLEHEIAWAQVVALEKERNSLARDMQKRERSIPKYTKKVEDCKAEVEKGESSIHELEEELKLVNQEAAERQRRHKTVQEDMKKKRDAYGKAKRELQAVAHECRGEERARNELRNRLAELSAASSRKSRENQEMIRKARKQELQDEVEHLRSEMAEEQRQKTNLETTIHRKTEQLYDVQRKIGDSKRQVERYDHELSGLERNRGNKLQVYGDWMPRLVYAIDKEHGFHKKPYGPLGRYLKLIEEKWALAVESVLGSGLLAAFCCHDQHDLQLLRRLVTTHCPRDRQPNLIKQTFREESYDVSLSRPHCDQPTFFDIVKCSEPVVFNALVDQRKVESILMIEKSDMAKRVMHFNTPRGAKEAFTLNGDQLFGGTNRYYSCQQNKAHFVQQSVEGRIVEVREQRDEAHCTLKQLQREKKEIDDEKKGVSRQCDQVKVQLHRKEHQINQIRGVCLLVLDVWFSLDRIMYSNLQVGINSNVDC